MGQWGKIWVRTSDHVIRNPALYLWTTAAPTACLFNQGILQRSGNKNYHFKWNACSLISEQELQQEFSSLITVVMLWCNWILMFLQDYMQSLSHDVICNAQHLSCMFRFIIGSQKIWLPRTNYNTYRYMFISTRISTWSAKYCFAGFQEI